MARLPRLCLPGIAQHIIQRGTNRQPCFGSAEDMAAYAAWLDEYARKYGVAVHAWVFMTNHVHLLVTPTSSDGVSRLMQSLGRSYVRYFNQTYRRSGTLWEGRFRSCLVEAEDYLLTCQRYIELNPVRAGMVSRPGDYHWSSFHANGVGLASRLISHHPVYLALGHSPAERQACYRKLFETRLDDDDLVRIRGVTHQGLVLGSESFVREVEQLAGRRARPFKRGPRPSADSGEEFLL
jgi:putative transposase